MNCLQQPGQALKVPRFLITSLVTVIFNKSCKLTSISSEIFFLKKGQSLQRSGFVSYIMSPGLIEPLRDANGHFNSKKWNKEDHAPSKEAVNPDKVKYEPGRTPHESHTFYEHEDLCPFFPDIHWPPLTETPYLDKGLQGDPQFRRLLSSATDVFDYNPKIGTEVHGINLAKLTDAQKDDLARLISVRGVVFFRNQVDLDIDAQRELGQYFGKLHKHATTAVPRKAGLEDVHVVFTDMDSKDQRAVFTPTFLWHSDVSTRCRPWTSRCKNT